MLVTGSHEAPDIAVQKSMQLLEPYAIQVSGTRETEPSARGGR